MTDPQDPSRSQYPNPSLHDVDAGFLLPYSFSSMSGQGTHGSVRCEQSCLSVEALATRLLNRYLAHQIPPDRVDLERGPSGLAVTIRFGTPGPGSAVTDLRIGTEPFGPGAPSHPVHRQTRSFVTTTFFASV
ncbi:hypothetical protein GOHSU_40_00120 [Gordonia hirsuta DSM 44140 = NBRC 16056]|uniref:Uncharacterized protein n=1 Tax=Gordonia hirsuta DSM 44140 = NBRC 16056 TaxID=1121927 RepID=L7LEE6_9ACTN|nr:hypothetical protein [Gordonia hirsuta]GAC58428.1 hypothetical protein GOHSU_40_00120 [Gordonia hirsuta DSM 44140 = NBRC 16056]